MKHKKNLFAFLLSAAVLLMGMSSGYQEDDEDGKAGHNGSPGELTCAKSNCHTSFTLNSGPGSVSISAPGMTNWQYVPGQSYTISVTVAQTSVPLFGFGFEALLASGANAGTLTAGVGSHALNATVSGNSRRTITHLLDAGLSTGSHTFNFTWVAPANGAAVTFYAAGNAANNNGSKTGDYIYTTSQAVTAAIIPSAPTIVAADDLVLCNGETVALSVTAQSGVNFTWFDADNVQVGSGTNFTASQSGCYHVNADATGGSATSTNTVCVEATTLNASFSGLNTDYCLNDAPANLSFNTSGGTLTGNGIVGNAFNPQLAGVGSHTITYQVSSPNGCASSSSFNVEVHPSFSPAFTVAANEVCANENLIQLSPENDGGVFTGNGVSGNTFNPAVGEGNYIVEYTIGEGSCQTTSETTIVVFPLPDASFTGLDPEYCSNEIAVELSATAPNGNFSGPGITANSFDPGAAGAGTHTITFQVTDNNNCSAASTQNVIIHEEVSALFALQTNTFCANDDPALFMAESPGGVYSIDGSPVENFNPAIGAGNYQIQYTTGEGSCEVFSTIEVSVLAIDDATFTGLASGYCSLAEPVELLPTTDGGVFEGAGISGNVFNPAEAGLGENIITYNLLAENGCASSSTATVFVSESANSEFSGLTENACENDLPVQLIPVSNGGVFSGDGVINNTFDPALAGPGMHDVTYTIDFVGCSASTSIATNVFDVAELSVTGLNDSYCFDDVLSALVPNITAATLEGEGISQNSFIPELAGVGVHLITCTYTDENNCVAQWSTSVEVKELPVETVSLNGIVLTADQNNASYQWLECAETLAEIPDQTSQIFIPENTGSYAVRVTLDGCDVISNCFEIIVIGVSENSTFDVNVFPNPGSDILSIQSTEGVQIRILSNDGKCVISDSNYLTSRAIDLSTFESGMYNVVITSKSSIQNRKVLIQK